MQIVVRTRRRQKAEAKEAQVEQRVREDALTRTIQDIRESSASRVDRLLAMLWSYEPMLPEPIRGLLHEDWDSPVRGRHRSS